MINDWITTLDACGKGRTKTSPCTERERERERECEWMGDATVASKWLWGVLKRIWVQSCGMLRTMYRALFLVKGAVELVSLVFFLAFEVSKWSVVWCVHVFLRFTKNGCSWLWCSPSYLRDMQCLLLALWGPFEAECCPTRAEALTEWDGLCEKLLEKQNGLVMTYHKLHLQTPRFSSQSLNRPLFGLLFCINSRVLTTMRMRMRMMMMVMMMMMLMLMMFHDVS